MQCPWKQVKNYSPLGSKVYTCSVIIVICTMQLKSGQREDKLKTTMSVTAIMFVG
jgi:hypothetical protein